MLRSDNGKLKKGIYKIPTKQSEKVEHREERVVFQREYNTEYKVSKYNISLEKLPF